MVLKEWPVWDVRLNMLSWAVVHCQVLLGSLKRHTLHGWQLQHWGVVSLGTSPGWTQFHAGACRGGPVPTLQLVLGSFPCKTQQLLLLPPAFMEIETSILISPSSQLLPGNSKVRFYEVVWFVSQLSPKGPALWISCFIGALTLFALWAVGIMFRKVRILLKCKNIIPKFALYQVRTLIFLVRISLNCWCNSVSLVLSPLLKMYSIFSH